MTEYKRDQTYTIGELAELEDISIRTLHYYGQIDLLKPSYRSSNDYRYNEFEDL